MTDVSDTKALCERMRGLGDPKQWASNHAVALCDEGADAIETLVAKIDALQIKVATIERDLSLCKYRAKDAEQEPDARDNGMPLKDAAS